MDTAGTPNGIYPTDYAVYLVNANQAFVMSNDKHSTYLLLAGTAQLQTGSFMDYAMPRADDMPHFGFSYNEILCTTNPLGIKGCGEAGTVGAAPAVMNAVLDALWEKGVRHVDMPMTPLRVWETVRAAAE